MSDTPALRIAPPAFLAEPALAAVMAALPEARVVGGAVRDVLAGRAVGEVDLATPRTPEQVTQALLLPKSLFRRFPYRAVAALTGAAAAG